MQVDAPINASIYSSFKTFEFCIVAASSKTAQHLWLNGKDRKKERVICEKLPKPKRNRRGQPTEIVGHTFNPVVLGNALNASGDFAYNAPVNYFFFSAGEESRQLK